MHLCASRILNILIRSYSKKKFISDFRKIHLLTIEYASLHFFAQTKKLLYLVSSQPPKIEFSLVECIIRQTFAEFAQTADNNGLNKRYDATLNNVEQIREFKVKNRSNHFKIHLSVSFTQGY